MAMAAAPAADMLNEAKSTMRTHFPAFPYDPPYAIQQDFMAAAYRRLQTGGIGLFESPTGTGKTLSLICSVLQWLEDKREAEAAAAAAISAGIAQPPEPTANGAADEDDEPDWMKGHAAARKAADAVAAEAARRTRIAQAQARAKAAQQRRASRKEAAARAGSAGEGGGDPDAEFVLDEWDSDGGRPGAKRGAAALQRSAAGADSSDSDRSDGAAGAAAADAEETAAPPRTQVIFASRTHSQLSQFVGELRRTPFALSVATVALASRKVLCVNEEVTQLRSGARISEKCLDLQQQRAKRQAGAYEPAEQQRNGSKLQVRKGKGGCPFLTATAKSAAAFREGLLAAPRDVEELAASGRRKAVCPYYAARRAAAEADLLLVPYGSLLTQDTREALGIRLEGAVVVIDEAHNLVDAVNGAHSAVLAADAAAAAAGQLDAYWTRFSTRLAPGNARHLQALLAAATKLGAFLQPPTAGDAGQPGEVQQAAAQAMTVNNFLFTAGLDHVNMFSLIRYVNESKVLFKVAGFADMQRRREAAAANGAADDPEKMGSLHSLVGFLTALTNADADGRIIVDPPAGTAKFVLLNAAAHFRQVTAAAHALILASGTLAPVSALTAQLFPGMPAAGVGHFACGHVVHRDRLLALALGTGPSGRALDLRHSSRGQPAVMDELARLLLNVCQAVPQGLVVFFPSFAYAEQVTARWRTTGDWARLAGRKHIFQEPRSAADVETMLAAYSACITASGAGSAAGSGSGGQHKATAGTDGMGSADGCGANGSTCEASGSSGGAMLLAVVGGKMAEGINFGDGLGRCVVMVGMPYPNPADPELRERMAFTDAMAAGNNATAPPAGSGSKGTVSPGQQYYQDLCMKAVNQCIGRCIRHAGDYAAVVLADMRYAPGGRSDAGPCRQLPGWVSESLVAAANYGSAHGQIVRFFRHMAMTAQPT